ncbi:MAG: DUF885 family protein [Candidatus Aminicenantes bacterium]|nr:MAG: DUF885 family protein [Candidatus Aminicenantes bacterium]
MKNSSGDYAELVSLFEEFRNFIKPEVVDGVPDFSASAMEEQYHGVKELQERLAAINTSGWDTVQKIDFHVVRAEMNGVEFDHRVLRQWTRDPGFYNLTDGIYPRLLVHHSRSLSNWGIYNPEIPLSKEDVYDFQVKLQTIPKLFAQAKRNLTEAAGDLATIAIRVKEKDLQLLNSLAQQFADHHPELLPHVEQAKAATKDYRDWLIANKIKMTAPAGVGKENYNWWMKNVHLIPYSWEELHTMIQGEYHRALTFLKLEEHKNRNLPDFKLTSSEQENLQRQKETAAKVMNFLREQEVITVPEDLPPLPPEQYPRMWGKSAYLRPDYRGYFEQTNDREPMTNVLHVIFGHYYLGGRKIWYQEGDDRPIRGKIRLFDMHEARSEALAFGIEEWLMQAGLFDERPRSKEIAYIWLAFRTARALSDLRMHSNEYTLSDGIKNFSEGLPYPWADADGDAVWWDIEETLRAPGHSTNYIAGKNMMQQLMAERSRQLGKNFTLRQFFDEFMGGGIIPISLTRWELTGFEDQIKHLLEITDAS